MYPPGHFPYGRVPVVRCSVVGPLLLDEETRQPSWDGTLLEAAGAAVAGGRWPSQGASGAPAVRRTQGRRLDLAGFLFGVHPDQDDGERERIAARLDVPTPAPRSPFAARPLLCTSPAPHTTRIARS